MSEGIPYADIVIIALVAGFILLRLRSVLGQNTGNDNPQFFQKQAPLKEDRKETIVQLHEKPKAKPKEEADRYLAELKDKTLADKLQAIKAKDPLFNVSQFLEGAKMAFEMVFDAFAKDDAATLKMLLAENIYKDFVREIESRGQEENKTETTLVAVASRNITDAMLLGTLARITVKFVSEQVTVVRNPQGEIVGGDASEIHHVENEWVFERDVNARNPNWKIIET